MNYYTNNINFRAGMPSNYPATAPAPITPTMPAKKTDYGPNPFVVDINKASLENSTYRTALWTGKHLQLTLMSLLPGEDIGLEVHPNVDQFLRVEDGVGVAMMGQTQHNLNFQQPVFSDYAIFIPAGSWHNVINTGDRPMKLYSIYAPPNHPFGTIHQTKAIAEAAEAKQ